MKEEIKYSYTTEIDFEDKTYSISVESYHSPVKKGDRSFYTKAIVDNGSGPLPPIWFHPDKPDESSVDKIIDSIAGCIEYYAKQYETNGE